MMIKSKNSCKCLVVEMCLGVKKWVTSTCSKNWKTSLLSPLLRSYPHQWWGWMELASMLNDINVRFWKRDSLVPILARTFIFCYTVMQAVRRSEMEPHAWMTLLMIYLYCEQFEFWGSTFIDFAPAGNMLWGDALITTICVTLLRTPL